MLCSILCLFLYLSWKDDKSKGKLRRSISLSFGKWSLDQLLTKETCNKRSWRPPATVQKFLYHTIQLQTMHNKLYTVQGAITLQVVAVVAWHFGFPSRLRAVLGHQTTPERNMEGGHKEKCFHRSCKEPQLKTKWNPPFQRPIHNPLTPTQLLFLVVLSIDQGKTESRKRGNFLHN